MSLIKISEPGIADIQVKTVKQISETQAKLVQSLGYLQMMCITCTEDEKDKVTSLIQILDTTVTSCSNLFNNEEKFNATEQF